MSDRYYKFAKVPADVLALIDALDDDAMQEIAARALHAKVRELIDKYDGRPAPPEVAPDWSSQRAFFATVEKTIDTIKEACRAHGYLSCYDERIGCKRGCWL